MIPERKHIPNWARREREADLDWIAENLDVFWAASSLTFVEAGRGAIVVDTTIQPAPGLGHPFGYFSQEQVDEAANDDTKRMAKEYDPSQEFVLVLLNPRPHQHLSRVWAFSKAQITRFPTLECQRPNMVQSKLLEQYVP